MKSCETIDCSINDLSDYILEHIFTYMDLYKDFNNILSVNKRWFSVAKTTFIRMKRYYFKCTNFSWFFLFFK